MAFNNKLRFFHTTDLSSDTSTWNEVYPVGKKTYEYKKDKEDIFYRQDKKGDFVFTNYVVDGVDRFDFDFFNEINKDIILRCETRFIVTQRFCNDVWEQVHVGKFTMNDGNFDLDRCTASFKQNINDEYSCFKDNKKEEFNILSAGETVDVFSPIQNNYEFSSCRNKDFLATSNRPCDASGGWKKFYTKNAINVPSPRSVIYTDSTSDDYINCKITKRYCIWISKTNTVPDLYSLHIYDLLNDTILPDINGLDSMSDFVEDNGLIVFTSNLNKDIKSYRIDSNQLINIPKDILQTIVWFESEGNINDGYVLFYTSSNNLSIYDISTGITKLFFANITSLVDLNISYGDDILAYHTINEDLNHYRVSTFVSSIIKQGITSMKFLHSEASYLTWFEPSNKTYYLQNAEDSTGEIIPIVTVPIDSKYYSREGVWLAYERENTSTSSQFAYNLLNRDNFSIGSNIITQPANLVYTVNNGWFLIAGENIQPRAVYLDSRRPSSVVPNLYQFDITAIQHLSDVSNINISAGEERIYVSGRSTSGDYGIWSVDMLDGSNTLIENFGSNVSNSIKCIALNALQQGIVINNDKITIYKENIQRNDELTIWFRESITTICSLDMPQTPGTGWVLISNNCNEFGTSKFVRQPLISAPPVADVVSGGCDCSPLINCDDCDSINPNSVTSVAQIPLDNNLQPSVIRGDLEGGSLIGSPDVDMTWYIENPRDGSTYTWTIPFDFSPLTTIISGQGTPILKANFKINFTNQQVTCQETNPCQTAPIPIMTIPLTIFSGGFVDSSALSNIPLIHQPDVYKGGIVTFIGRFGSVSGGTILSQVTDNRNVRITTVQHDGISPSVSINGSFGGSTFNANVPLVAFASSLNISSPNEICDTGLQTFNVEAPRPNCSYDWSVESPAFIVGSSNGESVLVDLNSSTGIKTISFQESCPIEPVNYQLVSPCDQNHLDSFWWVIGTDIQYTNNKLLKEVVEGLVKSICPELDGITSNLFQWNPSEPSINNYVYGSKNEYNYLTISQKSDIKNPNATEKATIGNITWDIIREWLSNIEVFSIIIDNILHIEHISHFKNNIGLDLTTDEFKEFSEIRNNFSYAKEEMNRIEKYDFEESQSSDFIGFPIEYKDSNNVFSLCVNEESEERKFEQLTTDLRYIQSNPSEINSQGFVILANTFNGTSYNVIQSIGAISGINVLNSPMSMGNLHDRFLRHNRILPFGKLNNNFTIFQSSRFFKKQVKFKIPLCCETNFNPIDLIKTALGLGEIEKAEIDYKDDTIDLNLKYE